MIDDDAKDEVPDQGAGGPAAAQQPDLYYHGIVARLSPRKNTGVVRTASGREVQFSYQMVLMSGPVTSPKGLREGMVVGYDLGWGRHGLRVTKIRTYPQQDRRHPEPAPGEAPAPTASGEDPAE